MQAKLSRRCLHSSAARRIDFNFMQFFIGGTSPTSTTTSNNWAQSVQNNPPVRTGPGPWLTERFERAGAIDPSQTTTTGRENIPAGSNWNGQVDYLKLSFFVGGGVIGAWKSYRSFIKNYPFGHTVTWSQPYLAKYPILKHWSPKTVGIAFSVAKGMPVGVLSGGFAWWVGLEGFKAMGYTGRRE